MVRAIPSRVNRYNYISGTSKEIATRTVYGHVMHTANLPGPGARLEREKTPAERLRETPPWQPAGHLGQPLQHHRWRYRSAANIRVSLKPLPVWSFSAPATGTGVGVRVLEHSRGAQHGPLRNWRTPNRTPLARFVSQNPLPGSQYCN